MEPIQNHKEKGSINIHITNELNNATGVHYRARFFGVDAIFLNRSTYTNPNLASTIAHEVGHYLELDHTHQYSTRGKCRKEAIDRNRTWPLIQFCIFGGGHTGQKICEMTGDFLRDTPADHDLNSNFSCSNDEGNTLKSKSPTSIQRVEIIDKTGVMKRSQQFTQAANQITISVSGLPGDVYTIRIFDGKKWHTAKIIVQR